MLDFGQDFSDLFEFFVKISPGYHTAQSQSPQGIILRRVKNLFWTAHLRTLFFVPRVECFLRENKLDPFLDLNS